jgi:phosphate transport system protein
VERRTGARRPNHDLHVVSSEVVPDQSDPQVRERVDEVRLDVVRLASLTLDAIRSGTEAIVTGDLEHAGRVVADDDAIDSLRHSIEDECLRIISLPGLSLADLRFVGVALKIAHELERSADLMVNVARTTWRLHPDRLDAVAGPLVDRMSRQVIVQMRVAVNAFVDRDPSWAAALADMDDTTDELERRLFRHVLEVEGGAVVDDTRLNAAVQLALVARHYERIGDHAVTIAEQVHFVATGEHARSARFRR